MNLDYLRYFLDVAETKSITHAARVNFISPQGMSRAMNELEKELDCKLLIRYSNKLALSEQGEALIPVAKKVVEQYEKLANFALDLDATDQEEKKQEQIQLLCQAICGLCFIPPQTIKLFNSLDAPLVYREMDNAEIASTLSQNAENGKPKRKQIGIVCTFDIDKQENFLYIKQLEQLGYSYHPYLLTYDECIVARDSELATKSIITKDDIKQHPLVSSRSVLYETIADRYGEKNIVMTSTEFNYRMRFVEAGDAIAFMPAIGRILLGKSNQNIIPCQLEDTYRLEVGFIGMKEDLESKPFQEFIASLNAFYHDEHGSSNLFELL